MLRDIRWLMLAAMILGAACFTERVAVAQTSAADQALALRRSPVVRVFEACRNAVVNISATQEIEVRSPWDDFFDTPSRKLKQTSLGSGFVIHPAGYIVTNAHVVARATECKVIFPDNREYPAKMVALDQEHDLAVLKIEADRPVPALRLGHSSDLMVGETVIAIGNPLGYQNTCTAGIVSALNRTLEFNNELVFRGLIQTDASINPGNSGGPLLNVLGELIGVNTAIRGDAQNIGFAIPVDELRAVLPGMLDIERRSRIHTGLHLEKDGGARVEAVEANSAAAQAGLRADDVVIAVAGQKVTTGIEFQIALVGHRAGEQIPLVVLRQGRSWETALTLAPRPKPDGEKLLWEKVGIAAEDMTPRMAQAMGVKGLHALLVTKVEQGGPAERIGVRRGDVITQFGRYPAGNLDEVGELFEKVRSGAKVQVFVLRVRGPVLYRSSAVMTAR